MRVYLLIIFFFIINCSTPTGGQKRVYICGDHTCANNKEVKNYFNNNISIEVYTITSDKKNNKNFSLVDLNLMRDKLNEKKKIQISDKEEMLKEQIKERKKLAKLKMRKIEESNKTKVKQLDNKKKTIKKKRNLDQFTVVRICKNLQECDIDKISKIIMDIGRKKEYPIIGN